MSTLGRVGGNPKSESEVARSARGMERVCCATCDGWRWAVPLSDGRYACGGCGGLMRLVET
jgi:hypothetical protein